MRNWPPTKLNVVVDTSSLVGALLKKGSLPEQALILAATRAQLCLSRDVLREIEDVFARPKITRLSDPDRIGLIMTTLRTGALSFEPTIAVTDCRDPGDDKYLELALAAGAAVIVSSDADLLVLHPWRGIDILTPADFLARFT